MTRAIVERPPREIEAVQQVFKYPLFHAIFNRRARRFALGAELTGGPTPFKSNKELCTYIWATYDRFPASQDGMQMIIWFQAHHLETDFYDKYYQPGAYHEAIARHFDVWHGAVRPRILKERTIAE
jgi:hypothetical protein